MGSFSLWAQYKSEKEATIPLDYFYIERQKSGILRLLLSKVNVSLSTGFSRTNFTHRLNGFGIVQQPNSVPQIFQSSNSATRYTNWFNTVSPAQGSVAPGSFQVNSDTATIGFKSRSLSVPLKATLHIEFDRYRIGAGYSYDYVFVNTFKPLSYGDKIGDFNAPVSTFFLKKYFLMLGGMVYRYYEYTLTVDANIGGYKLGNKFDQALIRRGLFYNVGATVEREMSEYLRLFVRPSYEIKTFKLAIPETSQTVNEKFNAFYLNVGFTYRLPELRRCPLKDCHAQLNHAHGNREYRSRRHPIWKKQNPHYGENYPTLIKYKGRNKYKLNPY